MPSGSCAASIRLLTMASIDSIKRAARKEAWYSDSWNPFRKNMRRSSTWTTSSEPIREKDIEAGRGGRGGIREEDEGTLPLAGVQTEPTFHSPAFSSSSDGVRRGSKENEASMTGASTINGKQTREAESEETAVERQSTRQSTGEEKARQRFVSKFFKHERDQEPEDDDRPKKRPWYKGKILKHKPYTVKNQLQATIFNSWINILLLAAPVGIGLNYAGIDGKVIFCVNFIAIIPLAGMLSFATEEISLHVGESLGGLLNASFGYVQPLSPLSLG
jgi:Ca2+:H+ antiporter